MAETAFSAPLAGFQNAPRLSDCIRPQCWAALWTARYTHRACCMIYQATRPISDVSSRHVGLLVWQSEPTISNRSTRYPHWLHNATPSWERETWSAFLVHPDLSATEMAPMTIQRETRAASRSCRHKSKTTIRPMYVLRRRRAGLLQAGAISVCIAARSMGEPTYLGRLSPQRPAVPLGDCGLRLLLFFTFL